MTAPVFVPPCPMCGGPAHADWRPTTIHGPAATELGAGPGEGWYPTEEDQA